MQNHPDFIWQMFSDIKFTIPEVNNFEWIRAFFKVSRKSFY